MSAPVLLPISSSYGPVLFIAASALIFSTVQSVYIGSTLRPRAKILYPQLYATPEQAAADPVVFAYNCAQRAHANYVENLFPAIGSMLVAGLSHPLAAGCIGLGWLGCRLIYFYNYTRVQSGKVVPEKPPMGHAVAFWLFQYALHGLSVKAAWDIYAIGA
jgi:glutathione S-transferase